jgi:hypothetical protein
LSKKVENLRRDTVFYGAVTSFSLFFANEACRFIFRTPLFRLKPLNVLVVLAGPTGFLKYVIQEDIDKEIGKLWRIHKTREEKGLGGSYQPNGLYKDLISESELKGRFPIQINTYEALLGRKTGMYLDKPFERFSSNFEEYPDFHEDWDRDTLYQVIDTTERLKPFEAKKGTVRSNWYAQPITDDESKVKFGGPGFESPFTEPPDPGMGPSVDQRQDERQMFAFNLNSLNQRVIKNAFVTDPTGQETSSSAPFWIDKLLAPAWFTEEKSREFYAQMQIKKEFE